MAKYRNTSNANQHIAENRFIGPNEVVDLTDEDMRLGSVAKGMAKGGWLIPILENVVGQSLEQTLDNELDHVTHQPEQPFNINIPIGGLKDVPDDIVPHNKAIAEAVERAKHQKQTEINQTAINKALGGYTDEPYIHRPVMPQEYGNRELNQYDNSDSVYLPPIFGGEDVARPSQGLDKATEAMIKNQMAKQIDVSDTSVQEVKSEKEAVKSPKVIPKKKVVKKPLK